MCLLRIFILSVLCIGCANDPNNDTLLGIDADEDGVRDDVQAHIIALKLDTEKTKNLLGLAAQYQTRFVLNMDDRSAVVAHLHGLAQAVSCFTATYRVNELWKAIEVIEDVGGLMSNTSERREVRSQLRKATPAVLHDQTNDQNCP